MGEPIRESEGRKRSVVIVAPDVHAALVEVAAERGHKVTWLASKLIKDGLARMESGQLAASA